MRSTTELLKTKNSRTVRANRARKEYQGMKINLSLRGVFDVLEEEKTVIRRHRIGGAWHKTPLTRQTVNEHFEKYPTRLDDEFFLEVDDV